MVQVHPPLASFFMLDTCMIDWFFEFPFLYKGYITTDLETTGSLLYV